MKQFLIILTIVSDRLSFFLVQVLMLTNLRSSLMDSGGPALREVEATTTRVESEEHKLSLFHKRHRNMARIIEF